MRARDSKLFKLLILGLFALLYFGFKLCTSIDESAENYDRLEATYLGEVEWQYYDISPSEQNSLWREVGSFIKRNREFSESGNDVRKLANKKDIIEKVKNYEINDFIGHVVDIEEEEVEIWANNLNFYVKFSDPKDVWELQEVDLVKFSMSLGNYKPVKIADIGFSGDARVKFYGELRKIEKIGKHRKINASSNYE